MSSQGSSSVRATSGIAFGPMSGDPLSRDVSMPSASSTEPAHEIASRPVDRRAAEPEKEVVSTSGRQGDEEQQVVVSCGDLQSSITSEECTRITREYSLEVVEPTDLEIPHTPLVGYVTLSERYLQFGVRFPFNPFFVEVLRYFSLTVFQIIPNGWAHMIGLFGLFAEQGMGPPTADELS